MFEEAPVALDLPYSIVEKDGSAGIVAEFDDPRDGEPGHG